VTREEIKNLILRRAYSGAFEDGVSIEFNLHKYAEENGINNDEAWKAFEELRSNGLIDYYAMGGIIQPTTLGLLHCEDNGLVSPEMVNKQMMIRTKLLVTLYDIMERSPHGTIVDWESWIKEAGISNQDFTNNERFMRDVNLIQKEDMDSYSITSFGIKNVRDYKSKVKRVYDFDKLDKLQGVTEQQRGHKLEDLLGEVIKKENWEVDTRVRAQGQENDIIIHKGLDYFFISCKWEKAPIQPEELDIMYSRASGRRDVKGSIIVSMSGFTDNCVNQAIRKMENCHIILFGEKDIHSIMSCDKTFTSLLEEKYKEAMLHGRILLEGEIRDVKPD
jgi:hypothetical protein